MHLSSADDDLAYWRGEYHLSVIHLAYILPSTRSSSVKSPPHPSRKERERKKKEGYRNRIYGCPCSPELWIVCPIYIFYLHIAIMFPLLLYDNPHAN
ncbi:hypothetical protein CEXT_405081 [Caerostris extrusa]|uniref:Uncharacterized protein n=1 Tax=Caerostris extrusa TaxID=172846 RepID=A0AAV4V996_CAEEX|nr:hypothetical protein CEXT_405081 [Caerostris extrusa]